MKDALVYHNTSKSKITFAWTSSDAARVKSGEKVLYATFQVLDTTSTETDIHLVVEEAYAYENIVNIYDLNVENRETIIDISVISDDSKVKNVEALIKEIGTVSYSKESLDKIITAAQAYSILTEAQKKQVNNFLILSEAMVEYERLRIEATGMAVSSEISTYMKVHGYALALTTPEKIIIGSELNAFNNFSINFYRKLGYKNIILSKEVDIQTNDKEGLFVNNLKENLIYFKHCPIKEHIGGNCGDCKFKEGITFSLGRKKYTLQRQKIVNCIFYLKSTFVYEKLITGFGQVIEDE